MSKKINELEMSRFELVKNQGYKLTDGEKLGESDIIYILPNENFVKNKWDFENEVWIEDAAQAEFIKAKEDIESKMSELYRDIKAREELILSTDIQKLKMTELRNKLNYIESKILIKL